MVLAKVKSLLSNLRLTPFDTGTEEGRSKERNRRMALTFATLTGARVVQVLTTIAVVRLALDYFGVERYGLWLTISSFVVFLGALASGVGNGTTQLLAAADGADDPEESKRIISAAYFVMTTIGVIGLAIALLCYPFISWPDVFNVKGALASSEAGPAILVLAVAFLVNISLNTITSIQFGLQDSYFGNAFQAVGTGLSIGGLLVVIVMGRGIPALVVVLVALPALAQLANTLIYFTRVRPGFGPRLSLIDKATLHKLISVGGLFLAVHLMLMLLQAADNLIVAHMVSADAVASFVVPQKLFNVLYLVLTITTQTFWPSFREAMERGNWSWVKQMLPKSIALSVGLGACFGLALLTTGGPLVELWVDGQIVPSYWLLGGFALWGVVFSVGTAVTTILYAANAVRALVFWMGLAFVVTMIAKIMLVEQYGLDSLPWAMSLGYGLCYALPCAILLPRVIRNQQKKMN
jgi:O-antigen/teichoic acid export membrane protein